MGIFAIIAVFTLVDSLEKNIKSSFSFLGSNVVTVNRFQFVGGPDYPWWKFVKRPSMKISEMEMVKKKSSLAANTAFFTSTSATFTYEENVLKGINIYGISEEFKDIQAFNIG